MKMPILKPESLAGSPSSWTLPVIVPVVLCALFAGCSFAPKYNRPAVETPSSFKEISGKLAEEKDQFGIPVAKVTFNLHENDKKLIEFGKRTVMDVMRAAGAEEVVQESRYAHLVGAARMGSDPAASVIDRYGRTHDVSNLFVCDGSILPTQGSANPGLTIQEIGRASCRERV